MSQECGGVCVFFFNDTATTEIYTLSLHDALPIYLLGGSGGGRADLAQGGIDKVEDIEIAFSSLSDLLVSLSS